MRLNSNISACAFKPSKNVSQTDMNNAIQILLINHYSIAIVYNYWVQKLGAPVSEIFIGACVYKPSVFPPNFFQNRIRFTYRRNAYMRGNRVHGITAYTQKNKVKTIVCY